MLRLQRLSLNGTVQSRDLVNVTITVPPIWADQFFNATVTGKGYLNVRGYPPASQTWFVVSVGSEDLQMPEPGGPNLLPGSLRALNDPLYEISWCNLPLLLVRLRFF